MRKAQLDDFDDDDEEDSENEVSRNSLVDDEAHEEDGYQEGDSLDSVMREYMEANEVPEDGVSIGSKDSDEEDVDKEDDEDEDKEDDEMDSFIVTDDDEEGDHSESLLDGTGDDLSLDGDAKSKKPRRSILRIQESSDDDEEITAESSSGSNNNVNEEDEPADQSKEHVKSESSFIVSERQTNKLLSKTIIESSGDNKKANGKNNKSLGATNASDAEISFSTYIDKHKSKKFIVSDSDDAPADQQQTSSQEDTSIEVPDRQVNKLLSKSVLVASKKDKKNKSKHNKSLGIAAESELQTSFKSYVVSQLSKKAARSEETLPAELVADTTETVKDVEMESPPKTKTKTPKVKVDRPSTLSVDAIMDRCQSLLEQANEVRRQEKLLNKKEIPVSVHYHVIFIFVFAYHNFVCLTRLRSWSASRPSGSRSNCRRRVVLPIC